MPTVDLYDNAYTNYQTDLYRQVRIETYGHDLGQTSWVTREESDDIPRALNLTPYASVLEIGCGSGRYALQVVETCGCQMLGIDINEAGIRTAIELGAARQVSDRVRFEQCDASKPLPFADSSFDAVFANDALCHVPGRPGLLHEVFRVLKPGGRFLFSDALVIGGTISHQEIAIRSSIGYYLFSPPGENEQLMRHAGFRSIQARDTTGNASVLAKRWYEAREKRKDALIAVEGTAAFEGLQRFLSCVHTLNRERRLLRFVYTAQHSDGK